MNKLHLVLEIIYTIAFAICCVLSFVTAAYLLAILDGVCVILGVVNIYLTCRTLKRMEEAQDVSEDT